MIYFALLLCPDAYRFAIYTQLHTFYFKHWYIFLSWMIEIPILVYIYIVINCQCKFTFINTIFYWFRNLKQLTNYYIKHCSINLSFAVLFQYMQFCYLEAISYIAKCTNCNIFPKDDAGTTFGAFILYPHHRK